MKTDGFAELCAPPDENGCVRWLGSTQPRGSGLFGRHLAHRVAWFIAYGSLPPWPDKQLHHVCQNPWCVNPNHLVAVTALEHLAAHPEGGRSPAKTHCRHGHPYTEENTGHNPGGRRRCRTCNKLYMRRYDEEKRIGVRS